jgi:4-hydroxybenzoate polyprenyltransferase
MTTHILTAAGGWAGPALRAMRPRQWLKNLLLFAGLLFAAKLDDSTRWVEAIAGFCAYSAVSSACYLLNDVLDAPDDRLHPVKRLRPIASGELTSRAALTLAAALAGLGFAIASLLGPVALWLIIAFAVLQVAYTTRLKRLVLADVAVIAVFFVIRAAAGAQAIDVRISSWLLACTALLALFLALAKRRGELMLVARGDTPGRAVLGGYSAVTIDRLLWLIVPATIGTYVVYAWYGPDSHAMLATVPFVAAGIGRYVHLVHRRDLGEEPERVLLGDPATLACVALWTVTASIVLMA